MRLVDIFFLNVLSCGFLTQQKQKKPQPFSMFSLYMLVSLHQCSTVGCIVSYSYVTFSIVMKGIISVNTPCTYNSTSPNALWDIHTISEE